ncbi:hypothetical protein MSG28_016120 [Choristoneura fumiferana]|uniref:Uncharacterized protein n=1 Tax=Choristoneura fumiferana TaxID=7141 RepID=A0ACC0K6I8_CHOFU|nr:hypothetical protein MSG28_016120 [Choristoneura fumiferana]
MMVFPKALLPIPELKCAACGVQFENLDAVVRHAAPPRDGCDPALRSCPQCGETFLNTEQLECHLETAHVRQVYNCDECDKSFATASSLGTHVDRVHLKIKPKKSALYKYHMYPKKMPVKRVEEICEICGKGYPSSTWLKYHQRTHTGERPYKCPECPKSYMTPAALQSHSVSHTGVRRWQCSQCPKTFLHQSSIYKHKLVHTGEKPFECHICNKTFTQSGSLATHVKYVHMKVKPPPRRPRPPRRDAPA